MDPRSLTILSKTAKRCRDGRKVGITPRATLFMRITPIFIAYQLYTISPTPRASQSLSRRVPRTLSGMAFVLAGNEKEWITGYSDKFKHLPDWPYLASQQKGATPEEGYSPSLAKAAGD